MNKEMIQVLLNKCLDYNRILPIPGIYRHFKEVKDSEDMIYAISDISTPLSPVEMLELNQRRDVNIHMFHHTELESDTWIFRVGDKYYHPASIETETLVIYTALYGNRQTYVRPLPMFISEVDKDKHPNVKRQYRFELI